MPPRATPGPSSEDSTALAADLIVAEYSMLREELHNAFGYAQTIIGWSFTAFGVTLGAGLVAASQTPRDSFTDWAVILLFGLFAPTLIWAAAISWLGELVRMERSSAYLRGLEAQFEKMPRLQVWGFAPVRYFRTVGTSTRKNIAGTQGYSYLGTALAYFAASALALGIFAMRWGAIPDPFMDRWHVVVLVAAGVVEIGGITGCFLAGARLWRLHHHAVPLS